MSDRSAKNNSGRLCVFLSYARVDMAAADFLVEALERHGFDVRIDRRDLPYGQKWQVELSHFIRMADTVVWLVSPRSVVSKWCKWELGEVTQLNKRLITVSIAKVASEALPEAIGEVHLLPAEGVFDPRRHTGLLTTAIETDGAWLREHTRLADHRLRRRRASRSPPRGRWPKRACQPAGDKKGQNHHADRHRAGRQ